MSGEKKMKWINGGRTRTRTLDPLIKSLHRMQSNQVRFDISTVRSGIEPEAKLQNVETLGRQFTDLHSTCGIGKTGREKTNDTYHKATGGKSFPSPEICQCDRTLSKRRNRYLLADVRWSN
jgi:hypothetical protein